jgi:peptidoglycan-associated lipoprotein
VVGLFGCAHAQMRAAKPVGEVLGATAAAEPKPEAAGPTSAAESDLAAVLSGDVLHFGFDQATLTAENRSRLQKIAEVLGRFPGVKIRIDGNCDERGTVEFNLALGNRRAAVAKEYLSNLGIDAARISIISYGKERPVATAHEEQAWAQNRRDDFQPNAQY